MNRYIAFLRAINVGGHTVKMDELRALFAAMDFANAETFIASGNVIFETAASNVSALQQRIEDELFKVLGYAVSTFLRTDVEVAAIPRYEAFPPPQLASAGAFNVALLADPLATAESQAVIALKTDIDDFHINGSEVYWLCRTKQSQSTFSNAVLEKALGKRATLRGMNTIRRLAAKYPPADGMLNRTQ